MRAYEKFKNRVIRSTLSSVETMEGETIETKVERITENNEPISDGAPEIFTKRADGVISAYNIRTDRWEIAADAMDKVVASNNAKRDAIGKQPEKKGEKGENDDPKVRKLDPNGGGNIGDESIKSSS